MARAGRARRLVARFWRGQALLSQGQGNFVAKPIQLSGTGTVEPTVTGTGSFTARIPVLSGTGSVVSVNIVGEGSFLAPMSMLLGLGETPQFPVGIITPPIFIEGKYQVIVATLDGVLMEEVPAKNLQFTYTLNGSGTIDFTMPVLHPKSTQALLDAGARELHVYRFGTKVWGGYLEFVSADEDNVRCNGPGFLKALFDRTIDEDKSYLGVDQFDIVRDLIDFTQAKTDGNLGITHANLLDSGITRTFLYFAFQRPNLGDAIAHFAEIDDGFDIDLSPNKVFSMHYPRKGINTQHIFELGKNIRGISLETDAENIATEVTAIGAGEGQDTLLAVEVDTAKRAFYKLRQLSVTEKDIVDSTVLSGTARETLRISKSPRLQPQFSIETDDPPFGSYTVGDFVTIRADHGYIDLDDMFRINQMNVAVSDEGRDAITVFFEREVE